MLAKRLVLIVALVCIAAGAAYAAVPPMISYQGRLTQPSGAPVADGTYSMMFCIYDVPTGGTPLWSETNPSVAVRGGLFATMLGSVVNIPANIFDSPTRFFAVKVGSDPEMAPRQQVASSAFAFRAATVDDGVITAAKLSSDAASLAKVSGGAMTAVAGSVGVGTTAPSGQLTVRKPTPGEALTVRNVGDTADTFSVSDAGSVSANVLTLSENSSVPSTPPTGKGTLYEDSAQHVFLLTSSGAKKSLDMNYSLAVQSASVICTDSTVKDIPGTDLALTAGTYLISAHFWGRTWLLSGSTGWGNFYGQIYNVTDSSVIANTNLVKYVAGDVSANTPFDLFTTLTISATKTIRLRGAIWSGGANFANGFRNDSSGCSDVCRLLAIKISQ